MGRPEGGNPSVLHVVRNVPCVGTKEPADEPSTQGPPGFEDLARGSMRKESPLSAHAKWHQAPAVGASGSAVSSSRRACSKACDGYWRFSASNRSANRRENSRVSCSAASKEAPAASLALSCSAFMGQNPT